MKLTDVALEEWLDILPLKKKSMLSYKQRQVGDSSQHILSEHTTHIKVN